MFAKRPDAGCTAIIVLVVKRKMFVCNVGDSRCVIWDENEPKPLSEDHKPSLDRETQRVEKAGGSIVHGRVNMKLSLTRAIGDFCYKGKKDKKVEE